MTSIEKPQSSQFHTRANETQPRSEKEAMGVDAGRVGSYTAGLLFSVGWWILIDGAAFADFHASQIPFNFIKYLPGIVSTLAFFLCVSPLCSSQ